MSRYRVLVVEDDPGNRLTIAHVLGLPGTIDALFEESGEAILEAVRTAGIDLVLMDISLNNSFLQGRPVDGLELTRRIKAIQSAPGRSTPVVLLTAHCMKGDAERFLSVSGADAYIAKPLRDIEAFNAWLLRTIEESRAGLAKPQIPGAPSTPPFLQ